MSTQAALAVLTRHIELDDIAAAKYLLNHLNDQSVRMKNSRRHHRDTPASLRFTPYRLLWPLAGPQGDKFVVLEGEGRRVRTGPVYII
jgi:hypothetical protein